MNKNLATAITKAASKQTYYTIRFLVDTERREDAYRAYAYFRWVDDTLDADSIPQQGRMAFLERQKLLLDSCYRGEPFQDLDMQESLLAELVQHDHEENSGLQVYLRNMMRVMDFDVRRRGRLVSQAELDDTTRWLAIAVTECIHYFIGHADGTPQDERRYLAVSAAHIIHMLRDTYADLRSGYFNIPKEVLDTYSIGVHDIHSPAYQQWVKNRLELARRYFQAGRQYFAQVHSLRCRLACFAYIARFEWLLDQAF